MECKKNRRFGEGKAVGDIFVELNEVEKLQNNISEEKRIGREASIITGGFLTIKCC